MQNYQVKMIIRSKTPYDVYRTGPVPRSGSIELIIEDEKVRLMQMFCYLDVLAHRDVGPIVNINEERSVTQTCDHIFDARWVTVPFFGRG